MPLIKLNAIDSTNSYLRTLCTQEYVEDYTAVIAAKQTKGRGQMGTVWNSQSSKNLTFSVFKDLSGYRLEYPFCVSLVTALALVKSLQGLSTPKLSIKWPNDILSENKKICGILIENVFKQNKLGYSIIGIGLNVNQTEFKNLPKASSLRLITGRVFDLDELANAIIKNLQHYFNILEQGHYEALKTEYETYLYRKDKPSTFKDAENAVFSGFIKAVSDSGNLQILLEDDIVKEFDLKSVTLMY